MRKVILVTGAGSGLGQVIAEKLASDPSFVVYGGVRRQKAESLPFHQVRLDITRDGDCAQAVREIIQNEGRLDILINNAGLTISGPSIEFSDQDLTGILDTNVVGAFRLIKEVVPHMKKQKFGKIINVTSLNGLVSLPNFGLYSSSKFALEGLGRALRYELGKYGIWVTNLVPGAIYRESTASFELKHKPVREKFWLLKIVMPMLSYEKVAEKVFGLIKNPSPPAEKILGADAKITSFLQKILPGSVWDKLMLYVWHKK